MTDAPLLDAKWFIRDSCFFRYVLREVLVEVPLSMRGLAASTATRWVLDGPEAAAGVARRFLFGQPAEHLLALCCDSQNTVVGVAVLGDGNHFAVPADLHKLLRAVAHTNATSVVLVHNHPSPDVTISTPDRMTTIRVAALLRLVEVHLTDHVIVSSVDPQAFSAFTTSKWKHDLDSALVVDEDAHTVTIDRTVT